MRPGAYSKMMGCIRLYSLGSGAISAIPGWRVKAVLIVSLAALVGCATPAATRYYTLSGRLSAPALAASGVPEYRVTIGPVTVPEPLDRLQIVLRVAPNRYAIADAERWSGYLKREIPRVIAEDVAQRLPAARVAADSQYGGQDANYRVLIDVLRFESVPGESITLEASWSVRSRGGERLREAHSVFVEQVQDAGVAPLVAAHETALAALGREIAKTVEALFREKP